MYDVNEIRKQFPMLDGTKKMQNKPLIYLDNSATTFKPYCVIEAMNNYNMNLTSNSHRGDYDLCYNVDVKIQKAREAIAKFINSESNEVVFTSGDTLGMNIIAYGYGHKFLKPGDEVIISEAEHASNVLPWFRACKETGATIRYVELNEDGSISVENLKKAINSHTKVVSLAHVSNVFGIENDVKELAKVAHSVGAVIAIDGAQSVPHLKTNFKDWDIDFLVFSAHKMCGPTGIGCLIGKYSLLEQMDPFVLGGGMNIEFYEDGKTDYANPPTRFEAGTLNISAIFGFKAAIEFIDSIGIENIRKHEIELINYAKDKLKDSNIKIYNRDAQTGILTFNKEGIFSQDEATLLNSKGIAVRSGKHCAKLLNNFLCEPATVRASAYLYTTKEEIDALVDALLNGGDILDAYFIN